MIIIENQCCGTIWSDVAGFVACGKPKGHAEEHEGVDMLGKTRTYRNPTPEEKTKRTQQLEEYFAEQKRIRTELNGIMAAERVDPASCAKAVAMISKLDDREDWESYKERFLRSVLEHIATESADYPVECAKASIAEES